MKYKIVNVRTGEAMGFYEYIVDAARVAKERKKETGDEYEIFKKVNGVWEKITTI